MTEKSEEISLSWGQYFNFTSEEIETATQNVIIIKNKILQLQEKLEKLKNPNEEDFKEKKKIKSQIDRLEMSKECIKYYYKLEILL